MVYKTFTNSAKVEFYCFIPADMSIIYRQYNITQLVRSEFAPLPLVRIMEMTYIVSSFGNSTKHIIVTNARWIATIETIGTIYVERTNLRLYIKCLPLKTVYKDRIGKGVLYMITG